MSTGAPLRQPIPVGRSILWSPPTHGAAPPHDPPLPIFFPPHPRPPHPLGPAAHDVETHEPYFAGRWQVALLLAPDAAEPGGSFFRAGGDDAWTSTPLPFYELLAEDSIRPDGTKRSLMTWKDYRAFNPPTSAAAAPAVPSPAPTRVAPPPSGPRFTPTPRPAPPAAPPPPEDTADLNFLTAAEDMPPPLPSPPLRPARPSRPEPLPPPPAPPPAAPAPQTTESLWPA